MKQLQASYLHGTGMDTPIEVVSGLLDKLDRHSIDQVSWPAFNFKPGVTFALAHGNNCILLKYWVVEAYIRAVYEKTNDPVYKDSCVEMFLSFNGEKEYYNLEFNLLGTCLAGHGGGRENRQLLPDAIIEEIKTFSEVKARHKDQAEHYWHLTIMIPLNLFFLHTILSLKGLSTKANFFKCGDDLPKPHFLSWNLIEHEKPDFHLPEFSGEVQFL